MITKDGRDTPIERLTPDNYIVPKGEELSYHAVIEVVQYDPKTGKKTSRPRLQKFSKKMFEAHVWDSLRKQGYSITVLHDPNTWLKEKKAQAEQKAKEQAEAKAKAEQERFDAAVAAAVEKALAEKAKAEAAEKAQAEQKAETQTADAPEGAKETKKPGRPAKGDSEK